MSFSPQLFESASHVTNIDIFQCHCGRELSGPTTNPCNSCCNKAVTLRISVMTQWFCKLRLLKLPFEKSENLQFDELGVEIQCTLRSRIGGCPNKQGVGKFHKMK